MHDPDPGLAGAPHTASDNPAMIPEGDEAARQDSSGFAALRDDVTALVEDARTYAAAEIAFQRTRASLAGKRGGRALLLLVLALVLLHIALIALAVGVVIALAPLVTIWGGIAIVVGVLLIGVAVLLMGAHGEGKVLAAMFGSGEDA